MLAPALLDLTKLTTREQIEVMVACISCSTLSSIISHRHPNTSQKHQHESQLHELTNISQNRINKELPSAKALSIDSVDRHSRELERRKSASHAQLSLQHRGALASIGVVFVADAGILVVMIVEMCIVKLLMAVGVVMIFD